MAFAISVYAPVDPLMNECRDPNQTLPYAWVKKCTEDKRKEFNLHLPLFYIEFTNLAEPDSLHKIPNRAMRETAERLLDRSGNWEAVLGYFISLEKCYDKVIELKKDSTFISHNQKNQADSIRQDLFGSINYLQQSADEGQVLAILDKIEKQLITYPYVKSLDSPFQETRTKYQEIYTNKTYWKVLIPWVHIHGTQNQYHQWIKNILLKGDFGKSYFDTWRVGERIRDLFFYSFFFALFSIIVAYVIGIGLGILAAFYHNQWPDKITGIGVFALDAMPSFWVATLLIIFFANPDNIELFPSSFNVTEGWTFLERIALPLIAYTYGAFAAISRIMRASLLEVMNQEFITTARAKGLPEKVVIIKHALRNALLPMITIFASVFPALIGGSVILETIFAIPGMGKATVSAMMSNNIPMILAVFTLTGLLTLIGYLVADLLYAWADPRIRFGNKKN